MQCPLCQSCFRWGLTTTSRTSAGRCPTSVHRAERSAGGAVCLCARMHVYLCVRMHVYLCVSMHVYLCVRIHVYLCVCCTVMPFCVFCCDPKPHPKPHPNHNHTHCRSRSCSLKPTTSPSRRSNPARKWVCQGAWLTWLSRKVL